MSDQIQFAPILPPMPMILADAKFLATLAEVETQVSALKITDAQSAQHAANLQARLTSAGTRLDEARLAMKRPFLDINTKIDEVAKVPKDRIEESKKRLRHLQIEWDTEQRKRAKEAEEARQREIERLETIRKAEIEQERQRQAELTKIAAETAAKNAVPVFDVDFDEPAPPPPKTETERQLEAVKFAPAPVVEKPIGVAMRISLRHKVDSLDKLPDAFVIKTSNDAAIRSTFCAGYKDGEPLPECPGVTFWVERTPVSTGKSTF